jgi:RNA polymerase sigma-70 factor (ECF subfamily)
MNKELRDTTELELFEKIRAGSEEAFEILFRNYYTVLYKFTIRIVTDKQEAENIVQDLFVRFWIKRAEIYISSSIKSYLFTAARNSALNYIKRERRLTLLEDHSDIPGKVMHSPDSELDKDETVAAVRKAISKLPEKCRQIYLMKKYDDLSYNEISEILGISVNTIKTQMKRAIKSLTRNLEYLNISLLVQMMI